MSTIFVWTMTLMPALVSLVFVIGVPSVLGILMIRETRTRPHKAVSSSKQRLYAAARTTDRYRNQFPTGDGARCRAMSAKLVARCIKRQ
jgi:hypothetical protein